MPSNPILNGETLPLIGGPHDGETHDAVWLFPWIEMPASLVKFDDGSKYELDRERRAYVYTKGKVSDAK